MGYIFASNVLVAEGLDVVLGTVSMQSSFIFYNVASLFFLCLFVLDLHVAARSGLGTMNVCNTAVSDLASVTFYRV